MNLITYFFYFLLITSFIALIIHKHLMKEIKMKSKERLSAISDEIQLENQSLLKGKKKVCELEKIVEQHQKKFDHIKIEILHIHFSLKEICKFI